MAGTVRRARPGRPAVELPSGELLGPVRSGDAYEGLTSNFMEYLADAGGTVTNSGYTQATLNSAASDKAATFMRSLVTSGASPSAVTTFQGPQAMNTFGGATPRSCATGLTRTTPPSPRPARQAYRRPGWRGPAAHRSRPPMRTIAPEGRRLLGRS